MTPVQEWEAWRKKRQNGEVTKEQWLRWAKAYVRRTPKSDFRDHCETHIRFIENS
jgi:hypothetical protein